MSKTLLLLALSIVTTQASCDVALPQGPISVIWTTPLAGRYAGTFSPPSTNGERVFLLGDGVLALRADTGERLWEARPFEGPRPRFSATHGGRVFVGSNVASALDVASGLVLWRTPVESGGLDYARPGADNDAFYSLSRSGVIHAFDAETGRNYWRVDLAGGWWSALSRGVTVTDGVAYVALERRYPLNGFYGYGVVVALDATTGREIWRHENGDGSSSLGIADAVTVAGGLVLYADELGKAFIALEQASGQERWRVRTREGYVGPSQSPVVADGGADGLAYGSAQDIRVYAIELATGRVRWSREPASDASGSMFHAVCGSVVLNNAMPAVYALDRATGRTVGNDVYRRDAARSGFAVAGKRAFFISDRSAVALDCP